MKRIKTIIWMLCIIMGAYPMEETSDKKGSRVVEVSNSENFYLQRIDTTQLLKPGKLEEQAKKNEENKIKFSSMIMWLQVFINSERPSEKVFTEKQLNNFFYELSLKGRTITDLSTFIRYLYNYYLSKNGGAPTEVHEKFNAKMKLRRLNISDNQLTTLPKEFGVLKTLKELNLSHNLFTEFPERIFELSELEACNLSNNQISFIDEGGIKKLQKLKYLDISFNRLTKVPQNFKEMPFLGMCKLHNNPIDTPVSQFFKDRPQVFLLKPEKEGSKRDKKETQNRRHITTFFYDDEN
ncbi:MAG: Leucine Rich repeats (2 copies) [Candidatus Dependentiae bacterium ADurb.Bin331]|nr:MAG: Leucine Rich repeats (2 copies) [Candidatus Dependentiae bacterium ADurb.Bin331]